MYQNKLNLMPNDILEKDFKIDTRGYRLKEVDQYLDLIIQDYETLIEIIKKQEKEKDELTDEVLRLKQQLRDANINVQIAKETQKDTASFSNLDILKRLSNLEKTIYGKDSDNQ
ncbi:MAG: cell division regulator GpsB [bacterium]|nr:cell division regulator GpsB [bacterium]